jgi:protein-L-isoaspartate O-methyltransferase
MKVLHVEKAKQNLSIRNVKQIVCNAGNKGHTSHENRISAWKACHKGNKRYVSQVCHTGPAVFMVMQDLEVNLVKPKYSNQRSQADLADIECFAFLFNSSQKHQKLLLLCARWFYLLLIYVVSCFCQLLEEEAQLLNW